ncbi:hypothetical protein LCGC14_2510570, partial [marine sediment metagenome]
LDYRKYERAMRLVDLALKQEPESQDAIQLKAVLTALTEQPHRLPDEVKTLHAQEASVLLAKARQLWLEGQQVPALQLLTDIGKRRPGQLGVWVQLVKWYQARRDQSKVNGVIKYVQDMFKDKPESMAMFTAMLEPDPEKRMNYHLAQAAKITDPLAKALRLAQMYFLYRKTEEGFSQLRTAETLDPEHPTVVDGLFKHALGKSEWAEAEKYAQLAAKGNLDKVQGRMYEARLAEARGDFPKAIQLTLSVLRDNPRHSQARAFLGGCYLKTKETELARKEFLTAHEQNPSNVKALMGMVLVADAEGRPDDYARWVDLAYKFRPDNPLVSERYLQLRESRERPEAVIRHREQRYKSQPNDLTNLSRLGALYDRTRRYGKAEAVYARLIQATGGDNYIETVWGRGYVLRDPVADLKEIPMAATG